jgi:hypothetical protein
MNITVEATYHCAPYTVIEIPEIQSFDEVKGWYIKWDTFFYTLDGTIYKEIELNSDVMEDVDLKRPIRTIIFDEDYSTEIARKDCCYKLLLRSV